MAKSHGKELMQKIKREKSIFWICVLFMLILPFSSSDIGFSSDELNQWDYGRGALEYYMSFGQDTSSYKSYQRYDDMFREKGMLNYGSVFFMTYSLTAKLFPKISPHDVRHFLTALVGLLCIVLTGLITKEMSGSWLAAILAIWLMFLTPFFIGHSLVNDKDIPTAATMALGLYFIIRMVKELPVFSYSSMAGFVIALGLAIGVRIGGLLLVPYLFLFIAMAYLLDPNMRRKYLRFKRELVYKNIGWMLVISIIGFYFGIFWYPYILSGPIIERTMDVFRDISNHHLNVLQVFEGELMNSKNFPWYYQIKWIGITVPVIITILFLAFIPVYFFIAKQKLKPVFAFILMFATLFPIVYIIYTDANVYGRWRHVLFIYPTFISASSLSLYYLINYSKNLYIKYAIIGVVVMSLVKPTMWMIKNHPFEYIYTNVLVGWFENSYTDYPGDTYRLATLDSYQWLKSYVVNNHQNLPIKVVSNDGYILRYLTRNERDTFQVDNSGFKALCFKDWDYAIMSKIFLRPELRKKMYPPAKPIHTVNVDGVPVSAVIKRQEEEKLGFKSYKNQNFNQALNYFQEAHRKNPQNMCAWYYLGNLYLRAGKLDKALNLLSKYENYFPDNLRTKAALADVHRRKGNNRKASQLYYLLLQNNVDFIEKHKLNFLIGQCLYKVSDYQKASGFAQKALEQKSNYQPARQLLKKIQQK